MSFNQWIEYLSGTYSEREITNRSNSVQDRDDQNFDLWMKAVDDALYALCCMTTDFLPDVDYRDLYQTGSTPEEAAQYALENALQC